METKECDQTTPKNDGDNCFICLERKRHVKIKQHCSKDVDIVQKISMLTGENFKINIETNPNIGICQPCERQLNKTYDFTVKLRNIVTNNESPGLSDHFKCLAVSPVVKHKTNPIIRRKTTKRALVLSSPDVSVATSKRALVSSSPDASATSGRALSASGADHCFSDHLYSQEVLTNRPDHAYFKDVEEPTTTAEKLDPLRFMSLSALEDGPSNDAVQEVVQEITSNEVVLRAVQSWILNDIDQNLSTLVSRNAALGSVLSRYRTVSSLAAHGDRLLEEIIQEISERIPFLLDLFTVMVTAGRKPVFNKVAPVAAAYAILMCSRNEKLSAWHRMTTIVSIKGHLDDSALARFSHLGITQSTASKLRLMDEAGSAMDTNIVARLAQNPLVKITGDNLDIYLKTGHMSLERSNRDIHLFASNIMFSRICKPGMFSQITPLCTLEKLTPEQFFPSEQDRESLRRTYCVLLGRILKEMKAFSWMRAVVPSHIYHPYQAEMSQKSDVFQLPIQMKNEAKHEDCVDILEGYEDILGELFVKAFGSDELLGNFKVVVGGDQLTRVRLEEAKHLRTLATTPKKRFEDLQPFVIELWHTKQDFLEKCYKALFKSETLRQPGTLFNLKSKLQRTDVTGKVKGAFKSHHDFLLLVGQETISEQFLEYFGMEGKDSEPTKRVPEQKRNLVEREREMYDMLGNFLDHYGYLDNAHEKIDEIRTTDVEDTLYNYSSNLCHWVLQLMAIEDVVHEGDVVRLIPTIKYTLQFFFAHSRLSKYFVECLDFILKTECLLSPMQRMRVLEGAFTSLRGGFGENIESDLVQENSVRNQKDLIRALGANKTEKAIDRSTRAADMVAQICNNIDTSVSVRKKSSRHHTPKSEKDESVIRASLRKVRPFNRTVGRSCLGMPDTVQSPLMKIDTKDFKYRINQVISRLYYGQTSVTEELSDED